MLHKADASATIYFCKEKKKKRKNENFHKKS